MSLSHIYIIKVIGLISLAEVDIVFPWAGASNKGRMGKTSNFSDLNVNILKTVGYTAKVTINH